MPALFSLATYLLFSHLIYPFIRNHRHRADRYLPLDRISSHTTSIRHRLSEMVYNVLMPSSWARERNRRALEDMGPFDGDDNSLFDEDEGEDMVGFNFDARRREALERGGSEDRPGPRRLSRDLEEGFKDDSEEEADPDRSGVQHRETR